ncbi:MAG: hypothetical protein ABJG80_06915 [Paracoccaceae bacterium]
MTAFNAHRFAALFPFHAITSQIEDPFRWEMVGQMPDPPSFNREHLTP